MAELIKWIEALSWSDLIIGLGGGLIAYLGTRVNSKSNVAQATIDKWDDLYKLLEGQRDNAIAERDKYKSELEELRVKLDDMVKYTQLIENLFEECTGQTVQEYIESRNLKGGETND